MEKAEIIISLDKAKIDLSKPIEESKICLFLTGVSICSLGNFSLITGKAKSRKSFFIALIIAEILKGESGTFYSDFPPDKKSILYFDTEQSRFDLQSAGFRIARMIGTNNMAQLQIYCLREYNFNERLELIKEAISSIPDVGLVIIDGVRDLVSSINDEEQATKIASHLLKWTEQNQIHIISVLHQNKSDNNARGHLGSELVNKAESVLSVSKDSTDPTISLIEPTFTRKKEPQPIAIKINEDGIPEIIDEWRPSTRTTKKDISDDQLEKILKLIFNECSSYSYSELIPTMKSSIRSTYGLALGDNKLKKIITNLRADDILLQNNNREYTYSGKGLV